METKTEKAVELFHTGYNCAQSVFCAFCEDFGMDFETGLKLSSSFGGGMGRLREVCGAVSAMFMIAGLKYGYTEPNNDTVKQAHYRRIQKLAEEFEEKHNTIICRGSAKRQRFTRSVQTYRRILCLTPLRKMYC